MVDRIRHRNVFCGMALALLLAAFSSIPAGAQEAATPTAIGPSRD